MTKENEGGGLGWLVPEPDGCSHSSKVYRVWFAKNYSTAAIVIGPYNESAAEKTVTADATLAISIEAPSGDESAIDAVTVPRLGDKMLGLLCSPDRLEETLGCLEEGFRNRTATHGTKHARRWYYWHVLRTAFAFAWSIVSQIRNATR